MITVQKSTCSTKQLVIESKYDNMNNRAVSVENTWKLYINLAFVLNNRELTFYRTKL